MTDSTIFRTQTQLTTMGSENTLKGSDAAKEMSQVEVPYLDYQQQHHKPFVVDHFELGDTWEDPVGGFPKEVSAIEDYFRKQVEDGELANNVDAIKNEIKRMEKFTNVSKETRPLVRIETVAAYIEFLKKTSDIKKNIKRYGNT